MNIQRLYWPVHVLGPGARLGIWTRGCSRRCKGCMSEDLQHADAGHEVPVEKILAGAQSLFNVFDIDGVTISGGEPLDQAAELSVLLKGLRQHTDDILLYTGYTEEEIAADEERARAAQLAGVVISGPYVDELNDGRPLRGSGNQRIVFRNPELEARYEAVLKGERQIQAGESGSSIFLIGILG